MSKKKQGGKIGQHVSPAGKRLGLKVGNGQFVIPGMVLVRQRGTKYKAGKGVKVGRDHTLYALQKGIIEFQTSLGRKRVLVISK